jgi:diacylglycerol kinase (ATP)
MKYFLICNPGSRHGTSRKKFKKIFHLLAKEQISYDYKLTTELSQAKKLAAEANLMGYDVIVAVGGDGTINQVINGFYDLNGKRISRAAMGIIYTGTSPDFCKNYKIPVNINKAVKTLLNNHRLPVQIGRITYSANKITSIIKNSKTSRADQHTAYFGCCANIGLGASLARQANNGIRKYFGDLCGTFLSLLKTLASYEAEDLIIWRDKKKTRLKQVYNISLGITKYIASGIKVENNLQMGDQRFYCLIIKKLTMSRLPMVLKMIYSGNPIENNEIISLEYGKSIEIHGSINTEVEFDGDPAGFLPCRIEMAQDPLELITE